MRQSHLPLEIFFWYRVTPATRKEKNKKRGGKQPRAAGRGRQRERERKRARARARARTNAAQTRYVRHDVTSDMQFVRRSKDVNCVGHHALVQLDPAVY